MNYKIKYTLTSGLLTGLLFISGACGKSEENESIAKIKNIEVVAGFPSKQKMTEYVDLYANTIYQKQEIVRATFQGFVEKTFKNIGDKINKGDILFLVKTKEADAAASSQLNSENIQFNGSVKITARTDGVLTELNHQTGDYVSDGEQLALMVDPQSLKIILEVPFQYSSTIVENGTYNIQLPDGRVTSSKVIKKVPSIDPANQTQKFILESNNNLQLPANLNVSVKIPIKTINDAVVLPKSSIMTNETQTEFWVMKIVNDSLAVKLDIQKGLENENLVQIKSPILNLNDRFVIEGAFGLPDTAKILIRKNVK